jgi:hypothetical protein
MEPRKMRKRAILSVLLAVTVLASFSIGNVEANVIPPWYICVVAQVGANTTGYVVTLSDTTMPAPFFTNVTFVINKKCGTEMYAAALTAFARGCHVLVYLNTIENGSKCFALYATQ